MVGSSRVLSRHFMPEASLSGEEGLTATNDMQGGLRVVRTIVSCAQPPHHSLILHDKPCEPMGKKFELDDIPAFTNTSQHAEVLSKHTLRGCSTQSMRQMLYEWQGS